MQNQNTQQLLLDVRKSYRLLHDYQRLVMDSVKFISQQLEFSNFCGFPKFSGKPRHDLDRWAWDWLNMYLFEFHFNKQVNGKLIRLSILHVADTASLAVADTNKTDITTFIPPNESSSKIVFIVGTEDSPNTYHNWDFSFLNDGIHRVEFAKTLQLPEKYTQLGMQSMSFDIEDIFTEEKAMAVVRTLQGTTGLSHLCLKEENY